MVRSDPSRTPAPTAAEPARSIQSDTSPTSADARTTKPTARISGNDLADIIYSRCEASEAAYRSEMCPTDPKCYAYIVGALTVELRLALEEFERAAPYAFAKFAAQNLNAAG